MVDLVIDGKTVSIEKGRTVLEAAQEAGIFIPTLCHHESLTPYGACRFCTVEVKHRGRTRMLTACTLPAAEGMRIRTSSERVTKIRRMLAELNLARWPNSQMIQEIARNVGVEKTRFRTPEAKCSTIVNDSGCILCGMCVRLCDDVLKVGALGFQGRGSRRRVTTPFGKPSEFCLVCGACSSICPTYAIEHMRIRPERPRPIPAEFEYGMANRKPINVSFAQAVPRVPVIDRETCLNFKTGGCKVCEDNCKAEAINHAQEDAIEEIEVGAIILATGHEVFDAKEMAQYGYGKYPDVYSSVEFERMVNATGFSGGQVRTRDGRSPKAVGIIHCVGSRDQRNLPYCSQVCCMYSLKFAHLIREHTDASVYNFFIDMRCVGKGYEEFYDRLLNEGVRFVRGKVASVTDYAREPSEDGKLIVQVEDTLAGVIRRIPLDMVVLANGLKAQKDSDAVGRLFGVSRNQDGFFMEQHPKLNPMGTTSQCVFIAGTCAGPKDIPQAVAQASAAAAGAMTLLRQGEVFLESVAAHVREEFCAGCRICSGICPYEALKFEEELKHSYVDEAMCRGCGTCVAACPSGAIEGNHFTDEQILSEIDGLLVV